MKNSTSNLRSRLVAVICGTVSFIAIPAADAGDVGGYLHLDGGVNFAEEMNLNVAGLPGKMKLDPGFRADLALGYDLNRWAAVELEAGYFDSNAESVTLLNQSQHLEDTWLQGVPVLANIKLRYPNRTGFVPYVGAGAGGVVSVLSINDDTDSSIVFAYQFSVGVIYMLDELAWIDVGYKYFATADQDFDIGATEVEASHIRHHFIGASVMWRF